MNRDAGAWPPGPLVPGPSGDPDGGAAPNPPRPFDYEREVVTLAEDLLVPAGSTLRVGPGVTFKPASGVRVTVQGTLQVEGSAADPVDFAGGGNPESWHGIVVESGGSLTLSHAHIGGAKYGLHAQPGSSYAIDRAAFDTSFKGAVLESDGRITNSTFEAVLLFPAVTDAVSIDDPNGSLTIIDASPTVQNCRFDGSGGLNDMIRIGGESSPLFDHIYVHASHCGFHTSGGTNTSTRITNSVLENLAYGVMAYATQPIIEDSVFLTNSTDVGVCNGASANNAPVLRNNFYTGGALKLDASCDRIGTSDSSTAGTAHEDAGPTGL